MRRLCIFVVLLGLILSANFVHAEEKKEWVNKSYDLKLLKAIMVKYSFNDDLKLDDSGKQKIEDKISATFFDRREKPAIKFITAEQVETAIGNVAGIDMKALKANDPQKFSDIWNLNLPNIADAIIEIKVTAQSVTTEHIPQQSQWITQHYYTTQIYFVPGPHGPIPISQQVDHPISYMMTIPAHDAQVGHAGIEFSLSSTKTPDALWTSKDLRDGEKDPLEMTGHILAQGFDRLLYLVTGKPKSPIRSSVQTFFN